jgi:Xaa-Pro aminopeptidase
MSLSLKIQNALQTLPIDGWLITDNPLARRLLGIPVHAHITRRFFYFCPKNGSPIKIVHKIEKEVLNHLEGELYLYAGWREFEEILAALFAKKPTVAIEISKIPSISFTDGGTVDLLKRLGANICSSARLLQEVFSTLTPEQIESHHYAAKVVMGAVEEVMTAPQYRTEGGIQNQIIDYFTRHGCITDFPPIVAVGENSANPHYAPQGEGATIEIGKPLLIDLWCRQDKQDTVYADITRVCMVEKEPSVEYQEIFSHVLRAQSKAIGFLTEKIEQGISVRGYEVDAIARKEIEEAGYGKYFIHRLGHSIDTILHGLGANFDSYETYDDREILPNTCYSVDPGIYLPGKFGIRLETNVLIEAGKVSVTAGLDKIVGKCSF